VESVICTPDCRVEFECCGDVERIVRVDISHFALRSLVVLNGALRRQERNPPKEPFEECVEFRSR
jgi:hypothetical protein